VPEKFIFCPKNDGFARVWGAAAPSSPWLVCMPMSSPDPNPIPNPKPNPKPNPDWATWD